MADAFGPGANGPLIVTFSVVQSTDPLGLISGIAKDIEKVDGVASVPMAVPNENADTAMIQVIPTTAPDDPRTEDVVKRIQAMAPDWKDRYGVNAQVTGITAVGLDITSRLSGALLPFGIFVVGLSLILLMMVFRSIAVPVKAAVGYLLSVGSSFGAATLDLQQGLVRCCDQPAGEAGDHLVLPDHHDGHPVRPGHGLRGVPRLAHA